jgi:hypothetical protein
LEDEKKKRASKKGKKNEQVWVILFNLLISQTCNLLNFKLELNQKA